MACFPDWVGTNAALCRPPCAKLLYAHSWYHPHGGTDSKNRTLTICNASRVRADYVWFTVCGLECMMLVRQHEELLAGREGWTPPLHKYLKPRSMEPPEPPDPRFLSSLHVKVGISEKYPLEKAVDEVACCCPADIMKSRTCSFV